MSKERLKLKEFRNYIDFLDDSQDMQDHGRFIDTLQSLYEDGWFDWLYLYAKEQSERVQELEDITYQDERQAVLEGMYEQNKRYREALEFYADEGTYEVVETLPPTDEYQQPIEPVFKTVPIIYYDKGKEAREALEESK